MGEATTETNSGFLESAAVQIEKMFLGGLIVESGNIAEAVTVVAPSDLLNANHRQIYTRLIELFNAGESINLISLYSSFAGKIEVDLITDLMENAFPASAATWGKKIKEYSRRRQAIKMLHGSIEKMADGTLNLADQVEILTDEFQELLSDRYGLLSIKAQAERTERKIKLPVDFIQFGLPSIDEVVGGGERGEFWLIAGRPSTGKSALGLNVMVNMTRAGRHCCWVPVEGTSDSLTLRMISIVSGVPLAIIRQGDSVEADALSIAKGLEEIKTLPITIVDDRESEWSKIQAHIRYAKLSNPKLAVVFIDYIGLLKIPHTRSRQDDVSRISSEIKNLALSLNILLVVMCQLNRELEGRKDHRPKLSDLRESGCLAGDTEVYLASNGTYATIASLVGITGNAAAVADEDRIIDAHMSGVFPTGIRQTYSLTTGSGRTIRATANHRFLTQTGWRQLAHLSEGEAIAVPDYLPGPRTRTMSLDELALLGLLIGNGCTLPSHSIQYTANGDDADLGEEAMTLARNVFGDAVNPRMVRERNWIQVYFSSAARLTHGRHNPVTAWLMNMGVFGLRSYEKFVPTCVFEQDREAVAHFLRYLFSTDGSISRHPRPSRGHGLQNRQPPKDRLNIAYASASERLTRGVRSLLLRVGINSRITIVIQGRPQYQLFVIGLQGKRTFAEYIGAAGARRQERLTRVREQLAQSASTVSSHVYWDKIKSIVSGKIEPVFDATIPEFHNFVANDIIVHNSLEQDSDGVMLLYRDEKYNDRAKKGELEIGIAKNRDGATGQAKLFFKEPTLKISEQKYTNASWFSDRRVKEG